MIVAVVILKELRLIQILCASKVLRYFLYLASHSEVCRSIALIWFLTCGTFV